jgi:hypothetical protein
VMPGRSRFFRAGTTAKIRGNMSHQTRLHRVGSDGHDVNSTTGEEVYR